MISARLLYIFSPYEKTWLDDQLYNRESSFPLTHLTRLHAHSPVYVISTNRDVPTTSSMPSTKSRYIMIRYVKHFVVAHLQVSRKHSYYIIIFYAHMRAQACAYIRANTPCTQLPPPPPPPLPPPRLLTHLYTHVHIIYYAQPRTTHTQAHHGDICRHAPTHAHTRARAPT